MVIGSAMTVKKTQVPTPTNAHFPTTIVHCHEMPMVKTSHMPRSARRRLTLACLVILVQSVLSCTPPSGLRALIPPPSSSRAAPDQSIGVVLNVELPIYFLQPDMLPTPYEERTFAAWAQQIPNIAATLLDSLVHTLPQHGYHALKLPDQIPKADWSTFGLPCPGKTRQHAESGVWRSRTDTRDRIRRNTGSCPQTSIQSPALVDEWDLLPVVAAIGGADQRCRLEWHPCDSF